MQTLAVYSMHSEGSQECDTKLLSDFNVATATGYKQGFMQDFFSLGGGGGGVFF